jgi:hypothetical protein
LQRLQQIKARLPLALAPTFTRHRRKPPDEKLNHDRSLHIDRPMSGQSVWSLGVGYWSVGCVILALCSGMAVRENVWVAG